MSQDPMRGRARETKTYVCLHVFEATRPVLLVTRPDGDWCLLCGDAHPDSSDAYRVVGLGHLIDRDPSISEVLDLEPQEEAERSEPGGAWAIEVRELLERLVIELGLDDDSSGIELQILVLRELVSRALTGDVHLRTAMWWAQSVIGHGCAQVAHDIVMLDEELDLIDSDAEGDPYQVLRARLPDHAGRYAISLPGLVQPSELRAYAAMLHAVGADEAATRRFSCLMEHSPLPAELGAARKQARSWRRWDVVCDRESVADCDGVLGDRCRRLSIRRGARRPRPDMNCVRLELTDRREAKKSGR